MKSELYKEPENTPNKKKETSHTLSNEFQVTNNIFRYCYVFQSLVRHQKTKCTNLFWISINSQRFIPFNLKLPQIINA